MFCLCEARTSALYESIWLKILELAPGLKTSVKFIMSDYEAAAIKILEKFFPNANIHGCWFHYNQVGYVHIILIDLFIYINVYTILFIITVIYVCKNINRTYIL